MANATIRVKNVSKVRIYVKVRDLNDSKKKVFRGDLDPEKESESFEVKPHPDNLDYQINWVARAGDAESEGNPYVEDGGPPVEVGVP